LDPELIFTHHLSLNRSLSEKELASLLHDAYFEKLYAKALNFLSYRPRSEQETRFYLKHQLTKLSSSGPIGHLNEALINQIVKKLHQRQLVNDSQFTQWWIEQRLTHRPKGNLALKAELFQKGIDRDIIAKNLLSLNQEKKLAKKVLAQKNCRLKDKAVRLLRTRGFSSAIIYPLIDELFPKE
jgi:regulatory protein